MKPRPRIPYGVWTRRQGGLVLFDRQYRPMWQASPDGQVTEADPAERVDFTGQRWLWNGSTPRREREAITAATLRAWGVPG